MAAIQGKVPAPFPTCDWRFNEFPNPTAHALYATAIELMALPVSSQTVGNALLDIVLKRWVLLYSNIEYYWNQTVSTWVLQAQKNDKSSPDMQYNRTP